MKKLLSIAVLLAGFGSFSFGKGTFVMPFAGGISYDKNSQKDSGKFFGLYIKDFNKLFYNYAEINYEYDKIKYKDAPEDYTQHSLSVMFNSYPSKYNKIKVGLNFLSINNQYGENISNYVYVVGGEFYNNKNVYGLEVYYSDLGENGIGNAWQFSPYIDYDVMNFNNIGSFYLKIKYNHIRLNNKNEIDNKKYYNNFDISLTNYNPNGYTTTVSASFGKSSYKVDKGGFVLYNTGNVINYSYDITENIAFGKKKDKFIILDIKKTNVKDYDKYGNINNNLNNYSFAIMLGASF